MGNYQSTTGVEDSEFKVEICLKRDSNVVKYTIRDKSQFAKKEVTSQLGTSVEFTVDLVTRELSYHTMQSGRDGDYDALQEALLQLVKEIKSCVSLEEKPDQPEEDGTED